MKTLTIEYQAGKLSNEELDAFEKQTGMTFPAELKKFLLEYAGAEVKENYFDGNNTVSAFLLPHNAHDASMDQILSYVRNKEYVGRNDLIPFAIDIAGRPFYLSVGNDDKGAVYADRVGGGHNTMLNKLADSFDEFIDALQPDPES